MAEADWLQGLQLLNQPVWVYDAAASLQGKAPSLLFQNFAASKNQVPLLIDELWTAEELAIDPTPALDAGSAFIYKAAAHRPSPQLVHEGEKWWSTEANTVQSSRTGSKLLVVTQQDVTAVVSQLPTQAHPPCDGAAIKHAACSDALGLEQAKALQRKLIKVVHDNEQLQVTATELMACTLELRKLLNTAHVAVDEELERSVREAAAQLRALCEVNHQSDVADLAAVQDLLYTSSGDSSSASMLPAGQSTPYSASHPASVSAVSLQHYNRLLENFSQLKNSYDAVVHTSNGLPVPSKASGDLPAAKAHEAAVSASHDVEQLRTQPDVVMDAVMAKEVLDQLVAEGQQQQQQLNAKLSKANKQADELKEMYDQAVEVTSALEEELSNQASEMMAMQSANITMKAAFDKVLLDTTEQKQEFDHQLHQAALDYSEVKTAHDKVLRQLANTQMEYELLFTESSSQQSSLVQAMLEVQSLKRNLNMQQAYIGKLQSANLGMKDAMDEATGQQAVTHAQLHKLHVDAAEIKAAYDKNVTDAVEQKQVFDAQLTKVTADAAEMKAAFDKTLTDAAEAKTGFDAQLMKATVDAAEMKAAFDKSVVDAVEAKTVHDAQLMKATVDAAEMKAAFDKSVADSVEQKFAFDAQLMKATVDAAEMKAAFDKSVVDAVEQKHTFDAQMAKAGADVVGMKAAWDKSMYDATEQKAVFDAQLTKVTADAAEMKAAFDKTVVDAVEAKTIHDAQLMKATVDATEMKAAFDKSMADSVEQKFAFDAQLMKATADNAEMKAAWDKSTADAVDAKVVYDAQMMKATADAAEMKAALDKTVLDATEAKTVHDAQLMKATADAADMKAAFDKSVVDAVEQKHAFDAHMLKATADASEMQATWQQSVNDVAEARVAKAGADAAQMMEAVLQKSAADAAEVKLAFDAQLHTAHAQAAEMKSALDKSVLDAAEQKTAFDAQLTKATADATEMKSAFDKSVADSVEQKFAFDAELMKATADNAEMKAAFDKSVVDAVEQKHTFDAHLMKATADTSEMKAAWDKAVVDAVEQKTTMDARLMKATVDNAEMKAAWDKSTADAVDAKVVYDAQMMKATADAAEMKAALDKTVLDATEAKVEADAQLMKANADAADMKAAFDKSALDAADAKTGFDAQLMKATADATHIKAAFDKSMVDAAEAKTGFDAQLMKVTADAADMKATLDKTVADAAEQKEVFDAHSAKATVDAAEMKAAFDKTLTDAAEAKTGFDAQLMKATADAAEMKAAFDKTLVDAAEAKTVHDSQLAKAAGDVALLKQQFTAKQTELELQNAKAALEAQLVKNALTKEQEALHDLQDEHLRLLRQREVLQAELQLALNNYVPKAVIDAGTPADKMLTMLTELLDGTVPSIQDILYVQSAILESLDIYQPVDLTEQLLNGAGIDHEVGLSLLAQLGAHGANTTQHEVALTLEDLCAADASGASSGSPARRQWLGSGAGTNPSSSDAAVWDTVKGAVSTMLAATFTYAEDCEAQSQHSSPRRLAQSVADMLHKKCRRSSISIEAQGQARRGAGPSLLLRSSTNPMDLGSQPGSGAATGGRNSLDICSPLFSSGSAGVPAAGEDAAAQCAGALECSNSVQTAEEEDDDAFPVFNALVAPPFDEVDRVLEGSSNWQFDSFKLASVTNGHPLSVLGYYTIHQAGLISRLKLNPVALARFLRRTEDGYRDNPYHNATHAADVLQKYSAILRRGGLMPGYVDPLTHLACLLAATVHDYGHVGRTNDFLISSSHDLAVLYNDRSPLENHHVSSTFALLQKDDYNFLSELSKVELDKLRRTVIELVLGTDMKQHFTIVSHFTTVHRLGGTAATPSMLSHKPKSESGASSTASGNTGDDAQIVIPLDEAERMLSLQMALKCADIGHTGAALAVHLKWVACLEEEFFRQGDAERAAGMALSPLCDRTKQGVSRSQVGFYDIVAIPLYHAFSRVFTSTRPLLTFVMRNYKIWSDKQQTAA